MALLRITMRPLGTVINLMCESSVIDAVGTKYIHMGNLYLEARDLDAVLSCFDMDKVELIKPKETYASNSNNEKGWPC